MAEIKRLAEELGILDNEVTYYLTYNDLAMIINGTPISFIGDMGSIINLAIKRQ